MNGWWLTMAAVSALVAAVPTGREILAAVRTRRLARLVQGLAQSARRGTRIRVDADGGFDLSIDPVSEAPSDDAIPPPWSTP